MISPVLMRRSRSQIETEQEADTTRFARADSPATSEGSKRMRLRGGRGDHSQFEMPESDDEDIVNSGNLHGNNASTLRTNSHLASHGPSATQFAPGAIVRVTLKNFVTYEKADFFPGPNLNMVIGPNGTGKSSLVCAICLGLGYPASVLGRATSFGEFVKHGKETAIVEIELQKSPAELTNHNVKLKINREENTRQFWYNGKLASHKSIQKAMRSLRIQIDNLCQFLPQDKVAEFAGLNPVELLGKTLQAAAPAKMIQQQLDLKEKFGIQKQKQRDLETEAETLRSWQTRQEGLQADVERLKEREQIEKTLAELKVMRVIANYGEKKNRFTEKRKQKQEAEENLRRLQERSKPALEDVNKKQTYKTQVESVLGARTRKSQSLGRAADDALSAVEYAADEIRQIEDERDAAIASLSKKKKELGTKRTEIANLEAKRKDTTVANFNPAEYNHKLRDLDLLIRDVIGEQLSENTAARDRITQQGRDKVHQRDDLKKELKNLDSQEGQRLQLLRKLDSDAHAAYKWLQDHRDDFEKEVFGPPMLACSVKDKRYSDQVQSVLSKDDFLCFTAQTKNDHKKLTDQFYNQQKLAVAVRTITTDLSSFRPPIPREQLVEQFGLDGFALDYIDGPSPVLAMLCSDKKLHLTGVSLKEIDERQHDKLTNGGTINTFATGKTFNRVTRRKEYGPGATSTLTRMIQPGRFWTDEPVDGSVKVGLQQQLQKYETEIAELREQLDELKAKKEALDQQSHDADAEKKRLSLEKTTLQTEHSKWASLPDTIERNKKAAHAMEEAIQDAKEELSSFADKRDKLVLKKADLVIRHQEALHLLRNAIDGVLEAQVCLLEATSDVAALKERSADIIRRLEEGKKMVEELKMELGRAKDDAKRAHEQAQQASAEYEDPEERQRLLEAAADRTVESIDEDIELENAKLDVIQEADPGVLRDFQKRAKDIERLQAESATRQADMERLNQEIQSLREEWEPGLDELIGRINDAFSYNFEQISCAGEVGVHKDEDFDKWAVEIKVKFRENETLQLLDQHRQSGGERAVSTIFYLMSLQSMAQSPFRVVDEINQGMDPRNERMVHERMVEIACREHTSQYFLITPKLLSGLRYDERMKILCIASGEHMPDDGSHMDFSKCVKIKKQLLAAASA